MSYLEMPLISFHCSRCDCELDNYHDYFEYEEQVYCEDCMEEILDDIKSDCLVSSEDSYGRYIDEVCDI